MGILYNLVSMTLMQKRYKKDLEHFRARQEIKKQKKLELEEEKLKLGERHEDNKNSK